MKKTLIIALTLLVLVGCGTKDTDDKTIHVGVTPLPHGEFIKQLKEPLAKQGYSLKVHEYDDYKIPNVLVDDGTLDANYFQHIPYLTDFNEKNKTDLVPVLKVHYEPIALYGGKKDSLEAIEKGDVVLVPDDVTNLPRALKLLESLDIITLNEPKKDLKDIASYQVEIDIKQLQADQITPILNDADYAVINGNYALIANITDKGLKAETISEDVIADIVNVIAVKEANKDSDKTKALLQAFEDEAVKDYIEKTYQPAVISVLK